MEDVGRLRSAVPSRSSLVAQSRPEAAAAIARKGKQVSLGDYPVVALPDVEPVFVRAMILGAMAHRYLSRVPDLGLDGAFDAARATWDIDWPDDPEPRSFEAAEEQVDADLSYWGEE